MNQIVKACVFFLGVSALIAPLDAAAGKETFKDTFPYVLSRHFSHVERHGESGLEVTLMETQFRWSGDFPIWAHVDGALGFLRRRR